MPDDTIHINPKEPCLSWAFYGSSKNDIITVQKEINNSISDYSFYPEIEWGKYGYRAPEGYQVLGAWRHPETKAFVFLLDNPHMLTIEPNIQLILYVTGDETELQRVEPKFEALKSKFTSIHDKNRATSDLEIRLSKIQKTKSLAIITSILLLFTAVINGFSLYLRKLPPPDLNSKLLLTIYSTLVASIHFASMILLMIAISILCIFLIKYGILIIRKL